MEERRVSGPADLELSWDPIHAQQPALPPKMSLWELKAVDHFKYLMLPSTKRLRDISVKLVSPSVACAPKL